MLRRDTILIGGGATNRGVETSVREAFSMDLRVVVVRECCWGGAAWRTSTAWTPGMAMFGRVRTLEQAEALLRPA